MVVGKCSPREGAVAVMAEMKSCGDAAARPARMQR